MWKNSLLTEAKRGEIAKCGSIPYLLSLLDKGPVEGKYFTAGAIQNLVVRPLPLSHQPGNLLAEDTQLLSRVLST